MGPWTHRMWRLYSLIWVLVFASIVTVLNASSIPSHDNVQVITSDLRLRLSQQWSSYEPCREVRLELAGATSVPIACYQSTDTRQRLFTLSVTEMETDRSLCSFARWYCQSVEELPRGSSSPHQCMAHRVGDSVAYTWYQRSRDEASWHQVSVNPRNQRATLLELSVLDEPDAEAVLADAIQEINQGLELRIPACDYLEAFGRPTSYLSIAIPIAVDLVEGSSNWSCTKAAGASYLMVFGAKALSELIEYRSRPNREDLGRSPFQSSFPSLHASVAFARAGAIGAVHSGGRAPLLALACLVGRSRIRSHHHRFGEVLFGAAIGYAAGNYFGKRAEEERAPGWGVGYALVPIAHHRF